MCRARRAQRRAGGHELRGGRPVLRRRLAPRAGCGGRGARGSIAAPVPTTTSSACIAGRPALVRIVFDVADRPAVNALHRAVAAAGGPVGAPAELAGDGGGYGFGCKDPDGRNLAFVTGCADHADSKDQPDRPRKIAHVNLNTSDFDGSLRFFTQTLPPDRRKRAAVVPALRQQRSLVDRARQDQSAHPQSRRIRDARRRSRSCAAWGA